MLKITTCQAENTVYIMAAITHYIQERLGYRADFIDDMLWEARYRQLDKGKINFAWICGWPYVERSDQEIELLVAPVMALGRYQQRPIYFSDVIVRSDSSFHSFLDLRGATWAYNMPGSQSGCHIVRHYLAQVGEGSGFFGRAFSTGGHANSIQAVLNGKADAAAIDSTFFDWEIMQQPALNENLRVIDVIGPSAIPPLVVHLSLPPEIRIAIRRLLLNMHQTQQGREILKLGMLAHFTMIEDAAYNSIREMGLMAQNTSLVPA